MGQKVNPNGYRYGINKNWQSRWVAKDGKQMAQWLLADDKIRKLIFKDFKQAQIDHIEIERTQTSIDLFIYCGQPGLVLGKENETLNKLTLTINKIVGRKIKVNINVVRYNNTAWSARVIAREIADAIENRVSFRVAQKMAIRKVMASKALGIKTNVSGRLGGVEMAREEGYSEGVIPMNTIRSDLDYALEEAHTTYGLIGVKVWINRGEIFKKGLNNQIVPPKPSIDTRSGFRRGNFNRNNNRRSNNPTKPNNTNHQQGGSK
ncbi:MAG: 30S ribosomal protein S3 [Mycoplasma sp.]